MFPDAPGAPVDDQKLKVSVFPAAVENTINPPPPYLVPIANELYLSPPAVPIYNNLAPVTTPSV